MAEIASAYVTLIPSLKGSSGTIAKELGGAGKSGGAAASKGFKGSFMSGLKSLAGPMAGLLGVGAAVGFFKDAVAGASDLSESASKVGVVFGDQAKQIVKASKTSATAMGLSKEAYLDATGTLGNLLVSLDIAPKKVAGMSQQMVKLAGDLASFNNVSPEEALAALKSGLVGETEPLKRFGVNMNEATLKAEAMAQGILKPTKDAAKIKSYYAKVTIAQGAYNDAVKEFGPKSMEALKAQATLGVAQSGLKKATEGTIPPLTAQQKALAAQGLIMKQTKTAQGDFSRTSGGLANQQRILSAQFSDLKAKVGGALLPVVTTAIKAFTSFIAAMQNGKGAGGKFVDALEAIKGGLEDAWDILKPVIGFLVDNKEAVATFAGILLTVAAAVKVWTGAQLLLNVALTANPVGIIVVAIAALAAGLVIAWKKSETFRNAVKLLAIGFVELGKWGIQAFRFLLTAAFNTFDGILSAAEKGLGWIPGLGDKISGAREAFRNFGDATIAKLKGVEDRLTGVQQKIAGIPASKTFTLNMVTVKSTQDRNDIGEFGGPRRAAGGPVARGTTYLVGERGPELFTPRRSGAIVPNSDMTALDTVAGQTFRGILSIDRDGVAYIDGVARNAVSDGQASSAVQRRRASLDGVRF